MGQSHFIGGVPMKNLKVKKVLVPIVIILIVLIFYYFGVRDKSEFLGQVEGVIVSHPSEISGKIIESNISLGQEIKKGDTIAVIDNTNQKYVVEQLELNLKKTKLAKANSKRGTGGIADNNYTAAKAGYDNAVVVVGKAKIDFDQANKLYKVEALTKNEFDSAKLAYDLAMNSLKEAEAKLSNTKDETSGDLAELDIRLLESQLNQQKEILNKYVIKAACDGIVMSKNYVVGDMVNPGYNIAELSPQNEKYAVIYFPKDRLEEISYNQQVMIVENGKSQKGNIKYIDVKSQYTPKELQNTANRNQESVRVKVLIPEEFKINIGQKIEVRF